MSNSSDILLYIIAVFIPPIPVAMKRGCGGHLCLNFILWFLIWIPAVIHAFYIIASTPDLERYDAVNIPSHYQNHPPAGGYQQNQSGFYGNGPPPPPLHQGAPPPPTGHGQQHRGEEWDTPMQAGQQQPQAGAGAYGTHPQQQELHGYGKETNPQAGYQANPAPPSYHKQ